jgi:hypothetical protein
VGELRSYLQPLPGQCALCRLCVCVFVCVHLMADLFLSDVSSVRLRNILFQSTYRSPLHSVQYVGPHVCGVLFSLSQLAHTCVAYYSACHRRCICEHVLRSDVCHVLGGLFSMLWSLQGTGEGLSWPGVRNTAH